MASDEEKLVNLGLVVKRARDSLCDALGTEGTIVVVYARTKTGDSIKIAVDQVSTEGGPPMSVLLESVQAAVKGYVEQCPKMRTMELKVTFEVNA